MQSNPEKSTVSATLIRTVLRLPPKVQGDLMNLRERLFDETKLEYSYAAILRGLISLGTASLAGKESIAVEFAGARVPRGRKVARRETEKRLG